MASGPITSWQIGGEAMETVTDFVYLDAVGDCSHEIKKTFAPWKKSYDKPRQCIKKSKNITLPAKVHLVKAMVCPVVVCGCESWTIKRAESQSTDAFKH